MKRRYINPVNNYQTDDGSHLCILWSFLFGGIYFAVRGNWGWFFLWPILVLSTLGTAWFVLPFFTRKINRTHLLRHGYVEQTR